jgi:hypothetical protein
MPDAVTGVLLGFAHGCVRSRKLRGEKSAVPFLFSCCESVQSSQVHKVDGSAHHTDILHWLAVCLNTVQFGICLTMRH